MRDVSGRDQSTTVLGREVTMPIGIAPTAMQRMAHPDGECGNARGEYSHSSTGFFFPSCKCLAKSPLKIPILANFIKILLCSSCLKVCGKNMLVSHNSWITYCYGDVHGFLINSCIFE